MLSWMSSLYSSVCQPVLTYGLDSLFVSQASVNHLEKTQGSIVKQFSGLGSHHHHSKLVSALDIRKVSGAIERATRALFRRLFSTDSPMRDFCLHQLSLLLCKGITIPGTIVDRVSRFGSSPIVTAFDRLPDARHIHLNDGVVDSIRTFIFHENYNKPGSTEHNLVALLTRAF